MRSARGQLLLRGQRFLTSAAGYHTAMPCQMQDDAERHLDTARAHPRLSSRRSTRGPRVCLFRRSLACRTLAQATVYSARSLSTRSPAESAVAQMVDDASVQRVALALQAVLAAPRGKTDQTRAVSRAYVAGALAPLFVAMEGPASDDASSRASSPAPSLWLSWQRELLNRAWAASSPHFYWSAASSSSGTITDDAVAVPCDWRAVMSTAALSLPHEGATEQAFVEAVHRALDSTQPLSDSAHTRPLRHFCALPASLEGANGSVAAWLRRHFPDTILITRSARTGEVLYRCTALQRWRLLAQSPTSPGALRGPEYHQLLCLHRALERVHGAQAADLPVWTALRELAPHLPSSMVCPPVTAPHAWVQLLCAPSLHPYLTVQSRVGVRVRQGAAAALTAGDRTSPEGRDAGPPSVHAATVAESAHAFPTENAKPDNGPFVAPAVLCIDVTSFLSTASPSARAHWEEAVEISVRTTARYLDALSTAPAAKAGQARTVLHLVVVMTAPMADVGAQLLRLARVKCPNTTLLLTPVEVDLEGFLGPEHVLGAAVAQLQRHTPPAQDAASTAPATTVVCHTSKVTAIRAVLAPLTPREVTFYTPS